MHFFRLSAGSASAEGAYFFLLGGATYV